MKISYDPEVDALSITFRETTVTTKHLAEGIAADYDAAGRLAGIEVLDAIRRFGDRVFSLMRAYRSVPMSLADACLVGLLESLPDGHIFTLDRDFTIYRQHGRRQIPLITPER